MFYRTTLSIYRVAPEDKSWLYAGSSNVSANTDTSALEEGKKEATASQDGRPTSSTSVTSDSSSSSSTEPVPSVKDRKLSRLASSSSSAAGRLGQVPGDWIAPFTDCFGKSTPDVAYACPPIMYSRLSKRLRGGSMATACISYSLFGACCACAMAAPLRTQLRRKYTLPVEPCSDGFTHLCCSPCAVWQEYREVEAREGAWGAQLQDAKPQVTHLDLNQPQLHSKRDLDSARLKDITDISTKPSQPSVCPADS